MRSTFFFCCANVKPASSITRFARSLVNRSQNIKISSAAFILSARLVSLLMFLGAAWMLYHVGRRLWNESAGFFGALIFVFSPVTLYYAKNANLDMPMIFWLSAALLLYVRILQEDRRWDYLWLGIVAALAVCTKDQAYGFIAFMPAPIVISLWRKKNAGEACLAPTGREKCVRLALGLMGFILAFILCYAARGISGFMEHLRTVVGPASQPWREVTQDTLGQIRLLVESILRLMDAWTLAGLLLICVGFRAMGSGKPLFVRIAALLPAVSFHATFLAAIGYVYPRFMLAPMLALAPLAGAGAAWLCHHKKHGRIVACIAIGWIALAGLSLDFVMANDPRYAAQRWLEENLSPDARTFYVGDVRDMPRFNAPLDPQPLQGGWRELTQPPDVVLVSLDRQSEALDDTPMRLAPWLRNKLGVWGRTDGRGENPFFRQLLQGDFGYVEVKRFESPIARFVPDVTESANRTIIVLARNAP